MKPVRAAVVGTGYIATKKHLPAFRRTRHATLVAIVDTNADAARRAARAFSIPQSYASIGEMLAAERPDLVDICTPPASHAELAIEAIEAGANVLIEKPMATSVADCDRVLDAARRHGVQVCVGHSDLFYPPFLKARRLVRDGAIGEFEGMTIFLSTPTDYMTSRKDHWAHRLPGGVIGESGPHAVYLTLAFIDPITDVRAHGHKLLRQYPWTPFDDYRIELVGEAGVSTITSVYTSDQWACEVTLWGTEGLLRLDLETMALARRRRFTLRRTEVAASGLGEAAALVAGVVQSGFRALTGRYRNTHDYVIGGFAASIAAGEPPPVPGEQGREAVRVMDLVAARLSAQDERMADAP